MLFIYLNIEFKIKLFIQFTLNQKVDSAEPILNNPCDIRLVLSERSKKKVFQCTARVWGYEQVYFLYTCTLATVLCTSKYKTVGKYRFYTVQYIMHALSLSFSLAAGHIDSSQAGRRAGRQAESQQQRSFQGSAKGPPRTLSRRLSPPRRLTTYNVHAGCVTLRLSTYYISSCKLKYMYRNEVCTHKCVLIEDYLMEISGN